MIDKALGLDADVIMLDIEDGVPPDAKAEARTLIAETLARPREARGPSCFVRVNSAEHPDIGADLDSAVRPAVDGLVLAKVDDADQVLTIAGMVADREKARGISVGSVSLLAAIESAKGLLQAPTIARSSPRITGLMFGAEDLGRELGLPTIREDEAREMLYRSEE